MDPEPHWMSEDGLEEVMEDRAKGNGSLPAFLMDEMNGSEYSGLTKRELFAAMALNGVASDHDTSIESAAVAAVRYADALLTELAK